MYIPIDVVKSTQVKYGDVAVTLRIFNLYSSHILARISQASGRPLPKSTALQVNLQTCFTAMALYGYGVSKDQGMDAARGVYNWWSFEAPGEVLYRVMYDEETGNQHWSVNKCIASYWSDF